MLIIMAGISTSEVLRLRMRALGISGEAQGTAAGTGEERIAAVARHLVALQGQDWNASRWALGLRAPGTVNEDVLDAFNAGRIVRSWPMRGTIHITAAEDLGWIQRLTGAKLLQGAPKRRQTLGMSDAALDRLVDTTTQALAGLAARGEGLSRDAVSNVWNEAGVEWQSNWRYHVIWWMCQNGLATFGPVRELGEPLLVAADEWITAPREVVGDAALAELATRYVAARGPVREQDFAWWSGLGVREARRGLMLAHAEGQLTQVAYADASWRGGMLWVASEALGADLTAPDPGSTWQLLPSFDEHLLGYTDRTAQLDPAHLAAIVPGSNGMFLATAAQHGVTVATWRKPAKRNGSVTVTPLPGCTVDATALQAPLAAWAAFHGIEVPELQVSSDARP